MTNALRHIHYGCMGDATVLCTPEDELGLRGRFTSDNLGRASQNSGLFQKLKILKESINEDIKAYKSLLIMSAGREA